MKNTSEKSFTVTEIARAHYLSTRQVRYRAKKERWPYFTQGGNGPRRFYAIGLPMDILLELPVDLDSATERMIVTRDAMDVAKRFANSQPKDALSKEVGIMSETKVMSPQERMEKAAALLEFLDSQAIEEMDDLADVVGIVVRAKLGSWGAEAFSRAVSLRQL
jgi:hypothetical protein